MFDTLGTLYGACRGGGLLEKNEDGTPKVPNLDRSRHRCGRKNGSYLDGNGGAFRGNVYSHRIIKQMRRGVHR